MSNDVTNVLQELCPDFCAPTFIRESFVAAWERVEPAYRVEALEKAREETGTPARLIRLLHLLWEEAEKR